MVKKILILLAILLATISQTSIFNAMPLLNKINFVLFLILYLATKKNYFYLPAAIFGGVLLDFYSSFTFGTHLIAILAVAILINYAYFRILVGHRFVSFIILMNIGIFLYHILLWTAILTLNFLKIYSRTIALNINFLDILKEIAVLTSLVSVIYLVFKMSRNKMRSIFIPVKN